MTPQSVERTPLHRDGSEWSVPVIAIDVGHGANRDRLRRIAEATGGAYVIP